MIQNSMKSESIIPPNEIAMQQAWRFGLWGTGVLTTSQGKRIRVIDAGKLNTGPGPDFLDAKLFVDDETWVGNIEIHRNASDWFKHGHDRDAAYENVILHVVGNDDSRVKRTDGSEILQVVMEIAPGFANVFNGLLNSNRLVLPMCGDMLDTVSTIIRTDWLTALAFERLMRKASDIEKRLRNEAGNWLQTVYVTLARGLGFGINADNMERLARCTPFKLLLRHTDNIETVEALLFGQAGLLNSESPKDWYETNLCMEYKFYAHKYGLKPLDKPLWQLSVRNTANAPHRRIALLAKIMCLRGMDIVRGLYEFKNVDEIRKFLNLELSEYWMYHYAFGRTVDKRMSPLGKQSMDLLIINVLAPLAYARGMEENDVELIDNASGLWEELEGEKNNITRGFEAYGVKTHNAFESQALIQLHKEYCERRRCPECRIGHRLLSSYIGFDNKQLFCGVEK